jgi:hypothetical protein
LPASARPSAGKQGIPTSALLNSILTDRRSGFFVMSWFVYVIKSEKDGRLYKGMSEDVGLRLITHNNGKVSATKAFRPWKSHDREKEFL